MSDEQQQTIEATAAPTIESEIVALKARLDKVEADIAAQGTHKPLENTELKEKLAEFGIR